MIDPPHLTELLCIVLLPQSCSLIANFSGLNVFLFKRTDAKVCALIWKDCTSRECLLWTSLKGLLIRKAPRSAVTAKPYRRSLLYAFRNYDAMHTKDDGHFPRVERAVKLLLRAQRLTQAPPFAACIVPCTRQVVYNVGTSTSPYDQSTATFCQVEAHDPAPLNANCAGCHTLLPASRL